MNRNVFNPVWLNTFSVANKKKENLKKTWKISLKILKILVYSFLFFVGLWGCFQTFVTSEVKTETSLGSGFEFGFPYGTTGDPRYDLSIADLNTQYYTFPVNTWSISAYGPFFALFAWPGAVLTLHIMYQLRNLWGGLNALFAIIILLFIIRLITVLISIRSTLHSERISEIQGKVAEINAKYKDIKKDLSIKQKKQMEIQELYKRYKIKPFAPFEQMFVTVPIFLIVYRVVTSLRPIKVITLFDVWNLGVTPISEITGNFQNGGWVFLFFLLITIPIQIFSQKFSQILAKKRNQNSKTISRDGNAQAKKMRIMQNIFVGIFALFTVISSAAVGLYWFLSSLFTILQTYVIHKFFSRKKRKGFSLEEKLKYLGIE